MTKIVEITWVDSSGITSIWTDRKYAENYAPETITSVGYLLASWKEYVTIAQSIQGDNVGRQFTIPRGCIKKIRTVR